MLTELLQKREAVKPWTGLYLEKNDREILSRLRSQAGAEIKNVMEELERLSCADPADKLEEVRLAVLDYLSSPELSREILESVASAIKLNKGSSKKWGEQELSQAKAVLEALRDLAKKLLPLYDDDKAQKELGLLRALLQEFAFLHDRYKAEKSSQGLLDFDDLLILARDLLKKNVQVLKDYRLKLKTLLVDELQDTDPLQIEIVELICGNHPGRVFAVGDAKQSIYSFRGADVDLFRKFEQRIRKEERQGIIPLNQNFRSQKQILIFINHLFSRIFPAGPRTDQETGFDHLTFHKPSVPQEHFVESFFIPETRGNTQDGRVREAAWIASRIQDMVENKEERILVRESETRPVEYGDIAILFRAMTDVKLYERALRNLAIPFTVISGAGFFEKQEVLDILNLLKLLLYPEDEEALMGLLRSPIIGVRDDTLFFMTRGRSLQQGLSHAEQIQGIDETEREILVRAQEMIHKLRRARDRVRVPELIGRFLDETAYPALLFTDLVHGHQRYANLKKLMDLAREFSSRPLFGLSDFIDYIEELQEKEKREGESPIDEESQNTVRILTVHKAKGLEFPVVLLPDLGRRSSGRTDTIEIHPNLGVGINVPDGKGSLEKSFIRSRIVEEKKRERVHEEKRIFYVGCTRAKDFLVLSGQTSFPKNPKKDSAIPMDWLKEAFEITDQNYSNDIPYGDKKVKACSDSGPVASAVPHEQRWIDTYPELLQGKPVPMAEDPSAQSLIEQTKSHPDPLPPAGFTVSQLVLYEKCPKGYELSALSGISEPEREREESFSSGGRELGNVVHGILQHWNLDPASLKDCVDRELNRSGLADKEQRKLRPDARRLVKTFSRMDAACKIRNAAEVYTEVPFLLKLEGFHLGGTIDTLYRSRSGRLTVIDYKTDNVTEAEVPAKVEEEKYGFQLSAYALAAQKLFNEPIDTALVFLDPGITHLFETDPVKTETEILAMIREIQASITFKMNQKRCPTCGYWKPLCSKS
jgi:ATP-dependent helicase/nuclease subunit A